jgi:hypothetical protein
MTLHNKVMRASTIALALSLSACGGSVVGGGIASIPPPVPAPPTPPPPPPPSPPPPPPAALLQEREFATVGIDRRHAAAAGGALDAGLAADLTGNVEFRYLAAEQAYEILLPGLVAGRLEPPGTHWSRGDLTVSAVRNGNTPGTEQAVVSLYRPTSSDLVLSYTSFGIWDSTVPNPGPHSGLFAFGVPTAAGDVPTAGTGIYDALVEGVTTDDGAGIGGQAHLVFDFGAGTLSGYMDPRYGDFSVWSDGTTYLGRYGFTQTVYSAGSTIFSGKFDVLGSTADSFFQGQFTGPQAAELMARWRAPYRNPVTQEWGTMFGIWAGRKN